jgi:hypothetical protein
MYCIALAAMVSLRLRLDVACVPIRKALMEFASACSAKNLRILASRFGLKLGLRLRLIGRSFEPQSEVRSFGSVNAQSVFGLVSVMRGILATKCRVDYTSFTMLCFQRLRNGPCHRLTINRKCRNQVFVARPTIRPLGRVETFCCLCVSDHSCMFDYFNQLCVLSQTVKTSFSGLTNVQDIFIAEFHKLKTAYKDALNNLNLRRHRDGFRLDEQRAPRASNECIINTWIDRLSESVSKNRIGLFCWLRYLYADSWCRAKVRSATVSCGHCLT